MLGIPDSFKMHACKKEALGARSLYKENADHDKVHQQEFFTFVVLGFLSQVVANLKGIASYFYRMTSY